MNTVKSPNIAIDLTHMGRRATGIERITSELFGQQALENLTLRPIETPKSRALKLAWQMLKIPLDAAFSPRDVFVFPGFPPSPLILGPHRCVLYVHDLFLLERRHELNATAKYYMAPLFSLAVRRFRHFFVNSEETGRALRKYCRGDATILTYRPAVRNVFSLASDDRGSRPQNPSALRVAALGTIEPRKNYLGAARFCAALAETLGKPVELHIVGRNGWGPDRDLLKTNPSVILHENLPDPAVHQVIDQSDLFLCTSHAEGLGLPLLEVQYAGLPVVAPDQPIFREVLGNSGIYIDPSDPESSAQKLLQHLQSADWRSRYVDEGHKNLARWNQTANEDHKEAVEFLASLLTQPGLHA